MTAIKLTILGEPASKANSRRLVTFGKRPASIKSQKAIDYERSATKQIPVAARLMLTGDVRVTLKIYYASQRPDLDESVVLDVLQARYKKQKGKLKKTGDGKYVEEKGERVLVQRGVYVNDRQVREKHVFHFIDKANPRAEIEIEEIHSQQRAFDELERRTRKPAVNETRKVPYCFDEKPF